LSSTVDSSVSTVDSSLSCDRALSNDMEAFIVVRRQGNIGVESKGGFGDSSFRLCGFFTVIRACTLVWRGVVHCSEGDKVVMVLGAREGLETVLLDFDSELNEKLCFLTSYVCLSLAQFNTTRRVERFNDCEYPVDDKIVNIWTIGP
jgi:hypothetical protein